MEVNTPVHSESEQKSRIPPCFSFELHVHIYGWNQLLNIYVIEQEFLLLNVIIKDETQLRHLETTMWLLFCISSYIYCHQRRNLD